MTRRWLACALLAACASRPALPEARFANAPIAAAVNDRLDVARPPEKRIAFPDLYVFDGTFYRRAARALDEPQPRGLLVSGEAEWMSRNEEVAAWQRLAGLHVREHRDRVGGAAQRHLAEPRGLQRRR